MPRSPCASTQSGLTARALRVKHDGLVKPVAGERSVPEFAVGHRIVGRDFQRPVITRHRFVKPVQGGQCVAESTLGIGVVARQLHGPLTMPRASFNRPAAAKEKPRLRWASA